MKPDTLMEIYTNLQSIIMLDKSKLPTYVADYKLKTYKVSSGYIITHLRHIDDRHILDSCKFISSDRSYYNKSVKDTNQVDVIYGVYMGDVKRNFTKITPCEIKEVDGNYINLFGVRYKSMGQYASEFFKGVL